MARISILVILAACSAAPITSPTTPPAPASDPPRSLELVPEPAKPVPVTTLRAVPWPAHVKAANPETALLAVVQVELGDPKRESAIVHVDDPNNKSTRYEVYVLEDGQPLKAGAFEVRRMHDYVYSIAVRDRALYLVRAEHTKDDAECCPSRERTERWTLTGTSIAEDVAARKVTNATNKSGLQLRAEETVALWRGTAVLPMPKFAATVAWQYTCTKPQLVAVVDRRKPADLQQRLDAPIGAVKSCNEQTGCCKLTTSGRKHVDELCFDDDWQLVSVRETNQEACQG